VKSYAQANEDVLLFNALRDVETGFYIDVGANDPDIDSVTRLFYDRGWHGINIEPSPEWFARLSEARTRDINIQAVASNKSGDIVFHDIVGEQLGTLVEEFARRHVEAGKRLRSSVVKAVTLTQICEEHAPSDIHFLKIDVEGHEAEVLQGMDFARFRPMIMVIEATEPNTRIPTYQKWERLVRDAGYQFVVTDGLNRYYVAREHPKLITSILAERTLVYEGSPEVHEVARDIMRILRPFAAIGVKKARFGAPHDGGYVHIDDFRGVDTAFSFGIKQNGSWDTEIAKRGITVYQFDHTVEAPIADNPRLVFTKGKLAAEEGPEQETLSRLIEYHDKKNTGPNIMLKLDIGHDLWAVFDVCPSLLLSRFTQIVGVFHYFEGLTEPHWRSLYARVLKKLSAHYAVVHVHANNYATCSTIANVVFPNVLEVTFANRNLYSFTATDEIFPGPLDTPNNPNFPDICLGSF
jgi:FkbM family methyltransferase